MFTNYTTNHENIRHSQLDPADFPSGAPAPRQLAPVSFHE